MTFRVRFPEVRIPGVVTVRARITRSLDHRVKNQARKTQRLWIIEQGIGLGKPEDPVPQLSMQLLSEVSGLIEFPKFFQ